MKRLTITSFISLVLAALLASPAQAAVDPMNASGLAIGPAIKEAILTPGQAVQYQIYVQNITNLPIPVQVTAKNLTSIDPIDDTDTRIFDASSWFTIAEPQFILDPREVRPVTVTLQAPEGAEPGGHYATVFFQQLTPAQATSGATASMAARVGSLHFLVIKGDISYHAQVSEELSAPLFQQFGPVPFSFKLKNDGNVHYQPTGGVRIRDWRGKEVAKVDIPPGFVLPRTVKSYKLNWDRTWIAGKYTAQVTLQYGPEHTQVHSRTVTFWVIPWMPGIIALVSLALLAFFIIKTHRRWRRVWQILRGRDDPEPSKPKKYKPKY